MAIDAGTARVLITGDYSKLASDFAAAQGIASSGAQAVGAATEAGYARAAGSALYLSDSVREAMAAQEALVPVAEEAAGAEEVAAAATRSLGSAHAAAVTQIQATSGALRVLEGSGGIRAAERALTLIPGLGAALQTAFPLIGLVAVGEIISRIAEKFGGVSEAEKQATKDAEEFDRKIKQISEDIARINTANFEKLFGKTATLGAEDIPIIQGKIHAQEDLIIATQRMIDLEKLEGGPGRRGGTVDPKLTQDLAEATSQLSKLRDQLHGLNIDLNQSVQADNAKGTKQLQSEYDERQRILEVSAAYWKEQQEKQAEAARKATEEAKQQAEAQKQILEGHVRDLEEYGREADAQLRANAEAARAARESANRQTNEGLRVTQEGIKTQGAGAEEQAAIAKLQIEQQYGQQVAHSAQDQIQYASQLAAADQKALQVKISIAQMELIAAVNANALNSTAETQTKIAEDQLALKQAIAKADEQRLASEIKITEEINKQDLARQLGGDLYKSVSQGLPQALGQGLASGISGGGKKGEDVGKQVADALKGVGKNLLGEAFTTVIQKLIAQILVQTGIQAAFNALFPATATLQTAATTLNTAALAANTAALLASQAGSAGSTLSSTLGILKMIGIFEKGGAVPETGMAQVHKGEYVLNADQVAGRAPLPDMFQAPGGSSSGNVAPSTAVHSISSSASSSTTHTLSFGDVHLHGVQNTRQMMKEISDLAKTANPTHSPFNN